MLFQCQLISRLSSIPDGTFKTSSLLGDILRRPHAVDLSLPSGLFGVLLAYYNQMVSIRKPGASPRHAAQSGTDSTTGKIQQIVNFLHQSYLSTSEHKGRQWRLMCPSRALIYLWGSLTMDWFLFCFIRKIEYVDTCPSLGLFLKGMRCWSDLFLAFPLCELQGKF